MRKSRTTSEETEFADRLVKIRTKLFNKNNNSMADIVGISPTTLSSMCSGSRVISLNSVKRILSAIPQLNIHWLILGEGNMLVDNSQSIHGNDNQQVSGSNNNVSYNNKEAIETLSRQIEEKDRQINSLLKTLENMSAK